MPEEAIRPLRPTQYAEYHLMTAILDGTFPTGTTLPSERGLAERLGITRPTLRETLQRLAREGWITIRHGRPTVVNDYWTQGGLGMLATLARHAQWLPEVIIVHLLEVRRDILAPCARWAAARAPEPLAAHLRMAADLEEDSEAFARYDWRLQEMMVHHCGNRIYPLILNDFKAIFKRLAPLYFASADARQASREYYRQLQPAIASGPDGIEALVHSAMDRSLHLWQAASRGVNRHRQETQPCVFRK